MQLIKALENNRPIEVSQNHLGTPTNVTNLCRAVRELVEKDKTGIYNIVGDDLIDRYSFSIIAADALSLNKNLLIPTSINKSENRTLKPIKAGLEINKAKSELETKLLGIREGLELLKSDIRGENINK